MKLLDGALAKFEEVLAASPDMVPALRAAGQAYADLALLLPPDSAETVAAHQVAGHPQCTLLICSVGRLPPVLQTVTWSLVDDTTYIPPSSCWVLTSARHHENMPAMAHIAAPQQPSPRTNCHIVACVATAAAYILGI